MREEIFKKFDTLSRRLRQLNHIVQNPCRLTSWELQSWNKDVDQVVNEIKELQEQTNNFFNPEKKGEDDA